jgi:type I restriction enzyme S subunit
MSKVMTLMNELVDEISMGPFGSDIKVDNFVNEGVPVLNGSNVSSIKLIETSFKYVTPEKSKALKKANAKRGDIVITHRGTVGQISYIPEDSIYDNYVISQSQFRVALKRDLVDPIYFTYYFHTDEGQKRLLSFKSHVGVPALAQATTNFRLLEFPLIPLKEQKKIAKVLSDLDSKIELNNKINSELEAMAKKLYDYWFLQFDFLDVNGKPYKTSGGKMIWNEVLKREIPEGWEVKELDKVEDNIITGKTPSTTNPNFYNGNIPFITIGDVRGNMHIVSTEQKLTIDGANQQSNKFIPKGAICVTCIASPGLVAFATEDSQTNQQLNSVVCKENENRYYLYFYLTDYFKYSSAKTGNTFANMNKGDFSAIQILKPKKEILVSFSSVLKSSIDKILINSIENKELASLRDWLLPMLMNGQVTVGDVEEQLGMVAEEREIYKKD